MSMPNYLGTATGNTGIPSLLISSLQQVKDTQIRTALLEIQNWANSFFPLVRVGGQGGSIIGNDVPAGQGLLLNYGRSEGDTTPTGQMPVVFATPYSETVVGAWAINRPGTNHFWCELQSVTLTGAVFLALTSSTTVLASDAFEIEWLVLGA
jgi:hypothetical protein